MCEDNISYIITNFSFTRTQMFGIDGVKLSEEEFKYLTSRNYVGATTSPVPASPQVSAMTQHRNDTSHGILHVIA